MDKLAQSWTQAPAIHAPAIPTPDAWADHSSGIPLWVLIGCCIVSAYAGERAISRVRRTLAVYAWRREHRGASPTPAMILGATPIGDELRKAYGLEPDAWTALPRDSWAQHLRVSYAGMRPEKLTKTISRLLSHADRDVQSIKVSGGWLHIDL